MLDYVSKSARCAYKGNLQYQVVMRCKQYELLHVQHLGDVSSLELTACCIDPTLLGANLEQTFLLLTSAKKLPHIRSLLWYSH